MPKTTGQFGAVDRHLRSEDGRFLFRGKKLGICAACKSRDYTYDVGALGPSFRFCRKCITTEGAANLQRDANLALHNVKSLVDESKKELEMIDHKFTERFGGSGIKWNFAAIERAVRARKAEKP